MNNLVKVSLPLKQNGKQMTPPGANPSGTGVFYQAIPAVGADGKNVMKLIPVQRVNGQFVRMQTPNTLPSSPRNAADLEPQRLFAHPINLPPNTVTQNKVPVFQPALSGGYILKRPPDVNVAVNPVTGAGKCNERVTVSTPVRVQVPIMTPKVTGNVPVASPVLNYGKTLTMLNTKQLPVTVKSPALPSGHYLQIPPNAQVKTLPASALPQAIKKRILTPAVSTTSTSNSTTSLPTVVYVSPVNAMKLGPAPQNPAGPPAPMSFNRLPKPPAQPLLVGPSTSSTQPLRTPPKEARDPVTPIKWVVQERSDSTAPCLVPQTSSCMTSDILRTLAQLEKGNQRGQSCVPKLPPQACPKPTSQACSSQVGPGKDNALVMCNGKMYFVAKKTPEFNDNPPEMQKASNTVTSPAQQRPSIVDNISLSRKPSLPTQPANSLPGPPAVNSPRQSSGRIVIEDGPDEIIDLCDDDDPPDESLNQSQSSTTLPQPDFSQLTPEEDDSNVIFVSYIPPKSSVESSGNEGENDQERQVVQEKSIEHSIVADKEGDKEVATSLEQETNLEKTAEENQSQHIVEASDRQENEIETGPVSVTLENPVMNDVDQPLDHCTTAFEPKSRLELDRELKRRFQIKSDIKIILQRISESTAVEKKSPKMGSDNKRTLDGIRKLMLGSRVELKKKSSETQESSMNEVGYSPKDSKRQKVELSESCGKGPDSEIICRTSHPDNTSSLEKTGSPSRALGGSETEDLSMRLELEVRNISKQESPSSSPPEQSAAVLPSVIQESGLGSKNVITAKRVRKPKPGRQKSRKGKGKQSRASPQSVLETETLPESCPSGSVIADSGCEMPGPAGVLPELAMQDDEPYFSQQEQQPASVEICCPSTSSELGCSGASEPPGGDVFSAAPMDPEEIKRHEKIKRLKELLKEKEAALEMIRKNQI
ncbi:hypothetical protein GJAV_G00183050 [Gymnothorax javanicus]|nr:hypothetical protein GJAV_G00183050 [Gymnothorax javanicus]